MTREAVLFVLQRGTAIVLALGVSVHLVTIAAAVRGGLTAGEILSRTAGNLAWLAFYAAFAIAAALHVGIGLRGIAADWLGWQGGGRDLAAFVLSIIIAALGLRAAWAVYAP